ncbi:MAG: hypothetical protein M3450_19445, partial [Actinomycetota bacterium]|nr:hypothetical protein [Actinomycetota bacterium]
TDIAVLYVGDEAEKQALLLGEPTVFFTTPAYDGWPLVLVRLVEVNVERLAELVTDAWRMRAPVGFDTPGGENRDIRTTTPARLDVLGEATDAVRWAHRMRTDI